MYADKTSQLNMKNCLQMRLENEILPPKLAKYNVTGSSAFEKVTVHYLHAWYARNVFEKGQYRRNQSISHGQGYILYI